MLGSDPTHTYKPHYLIEWHDPSGHLWQSVSSPDLKFMQGLLSQMKSRFPAIQDFLLIRGYNPQNKPLFEVN